MTDKLPTPAMVLAGEQYQRQLLAQEIAERAKDPLNEAKRPGGLFARADGTLVDANDVPIKDAELTPEQRKAKDAADEQAEAQRQQAMKDDATPKRRGK